MNVYSNKTFEKKGLCLYYTAIKPRKLPQYEKILTLLLPFCPGAFCL